MYNVLLMKNTKTYHELGNVEFHCCFWQNLINLFDLVKIATLDKWHDEIEAQLCLKAVFHAAQELMVGLEKDVSLCPCQFDNSLL